MSAMLEKKELPTDPYFALFEAVKKNNIHEVEALLSIKSLSKKLNLDCIDKDGNTLLIIACAHSSIDMIKFLLKKAKSLLEKENNDGLTPYLYAARHNRKDVMNFLTSIHPKLNKTNQFGKTAFIAAAEGGHVSLLEELVKEDPNIWKKNCTNGLNPFFAAIKSGSLPAVRFLLKLNKDFHKTTFGKDYTTFMQAAACGSIPIMQFLLELDKDIWKKNCEDGWTPFMSACTEASIPAISFLLSLNPAFLNQADIDGQVPLHKVFAKSNLPLVHYLLSQGAKCQYLDKKGFHEGNLNVKVNKDISDYVKEVHTVIEYVKTGKVKELMELVAKGHTLNFRMPDGDSLLHLAFRHNQPEMALCLIELGLQKTLVNDNFETPFQLAYKVGNFHTLILLFKLMNEKQKQEVFGEYIPALRFFAKEEIDKKDLELGYTYFIYAARLGSIPALKFILELDKDAWKQNATNGVTPFMQAIVGGCVTSTVQTHLLQFLLELDKDAWKKNRTDDGHSTYTPFMTAAYYNKIFEMEFLLKLDKEIWKVNSPIGITPFMSAALVGSIEAMSFLLTINPLFLNQTCNGGSNALHQAAFAGQINSVRYLLSQGAKIQHYRNTGQHEGDLARENGHKEISQYLENVYSIIKFVKEGNLKELKEMVAKGYTLLFKTVNGDSLLHVALEFNQPEIAHYLLQQGLNKNALNDAKETTFQLALKKGNFNSIIALFKVMAKSIESSKEKEDVKMAQLKALKTELDDFIAITEVSEFDVDYEYLALNVDRKYWCKLADELYSLKKSQLSKKLYCEQKEKLSNLIYSRIIQCLEGPDGKLEFDVPEIPEAEKEDLKEKEGKDSADEQNIEKQDKKEKEYESDEERLIRLKWALKFALEGKAFSSAMRILIEMTKEDATLPEVIQCSEGIHSKDDLFLKFALFNYKSKIKSKENIKDKPYGLLLGGGL